MVKMETLIPFILYFEAGVKKKYLSLPPEQIFAQAQKTGYAYDPDDSGGATMCGITIGTYREYCRIKGKRVPTIAQLRAITYQEWLDVLRVLFWNKWKADQIQCQAIANILVDWVWASGGYSIRLAQKLLGVKQDGIVGAKTLAALNAANQKTLFDRIHARRIAYVEGIVRNRPKDAKYLKGWKRRINDITFEGLKYD